MRRAVTTNTQGASAPMNGPDFTRCGQPVEWTDAAELDERFSAAIDLAYAGLSVDIELCRWSIDDVLAQQYSDWWVKQRQAIRRHVATQSRPTGVKLVISRRTDKGDGFAKCYVRVQRQRPRAVRAAA